MGKCLGVDPAGLNIAFTAGTGILPFMDLIGFIARHTANVTQFDTSRLSSKSFHFWCNVRAKPTEKIGDELLSALSKANSDMFTYDKDFEGSERWTRESIEKKLNEITSKIKGRIPVNIWICGPPAMN